MKFNKDFPFDEEIYQYIGSAERPLLHCLAGISFPDPNYEIIRPNTNCYSFEYVYEGDGVIQVGDKIIRVSAGDFFILPPHKYHHYYTNPKNPWKKIFLCADGNVAYISDLLKHYRIDNVHYLKKANDCLQLDKIFELVKNDTGNIHNELEMLVHSMIIGIANTYASLNIASSNMQKAKAFIEARLYTKCPIDDIYKYCGMSERSFFREFKNTFNTTPMKYINQAKIEASKILLLNTDMTTTNIAMQFSFFNDVHFIRAFRSITGMTPTEYRKAHK